MIQKKVTIKNPMGLHARPAAMFVQFCMKFKELITIECNGREINSKSIMSILAAGITRGSEIEVKVYGDNENLVCDKVVEYLENISDWFEKNEHNV